MVALAAFGIEHLDNILGGTPAGGTVALVNDPGVEPTPFLYAAVSEHLAAERPVIYAVTHRSVAAVRRALPAGEADRIIFIDAFSALVGGNDAAAYRVPEQDRLGAFAETLGTAARDHPDAALLVEGLSSLADTSPRDVFDAAFVDIMGAMRSHAVAVGVLTRWPYGPEFDDWVNAFDATVRLRNAEDRVSVSQYFHVERSPWAPTPDSKPHMYRTVDPAGVVVYIPKIVVTGPHNAGKSAFVQALSSTSMSVDRLGTTVAMDHGHFELNGLEGDVFGTPGQERFDPILQTISRQALGVVLVVDATRPDTFARARAMLDKVARQGTPIVVAANKQDQPGALSPDEVARAMDVPPHARVVGAMGKDPASARRVVAGLVDRILAGGVET